MERPNSSEKEDLKEILFSACLRGLEILGWRDFSFAKISEETGLSLASFYEYFPSPSAVLIYLFKKIDKEVLEGLDLAGVETPRDALFEILMARFEAAQPYKFILRRVWKDGVFGGEEAPALISQGFCSMAWMLEAAKIENRGLKGFLRLQGVTLLYVLALRVWLSEEGEDVGKTMAFLDKGLARLEKAANFLETFGV